MMMTALMLTLTLLAPPDNLVPNPSFEQADGGRPAFWEQRTPSDAQRVMFWSADVAHTGTHAVGITNRVTTLSRWRTGHLNDLAFEPGSKATLSAWVKLDNVVGNAFVRLYYLDAKGEVLGQPGSKPVTGTSDWVQVSVEGTAPAQASLSMAYLELNGTGTVWFDDITLTGTPAADAPRAANASLTLKAEDAWELENYELVERSGQTVLQVPIDEPNQSGEALFYAPGPSAKYELVLHYLDEPDGASSVELLVNGRSLGTKTFDAIPADGKDTEQTFSFGAVDLQRHSRIILRGTSEMAEYARVTALELIPVGRFEGELLGPEQLPPPPDLRVFTSVADRQGGISMLYRLIAEINPKPAEREALLESFTSPEQWRAYQQDIRRRLPEYFGDWPAEKSPLNPKITGRIETERFTIDKLLLETRPNYWMSANFYAPKGRELPVPGVLFVCGHSEEGKGYHLYHECALGLVLKGYAVLAIDPMGQGERLEYFDPQTLADTVGGPVAQHQQLGRPSFLVGRTLAGYRTYDAIRGVDYLAGRPEVDPDKLAVTGNSGGGQMTFLVHAADERIKISAPAHPGGSMENTYLNGQSLRDREMLSLIAPRPCRVIVGDQSGETAHEGKVIDLKRFFRGLGADENLCQLVWVDGVHNMEQPKREAVYEWFNQYFGKEAEGTEEPPLVPYEAAELWATEHGSTVADLGSETGQTQNAAAYAEMRPRRTAPVDRADAERQRAALREAVAKRLGLTLDERRPVPTATDYGTWSGDGLTVQKLVIDPEPVARLPALLLRPAQPRPDTPVVIHVAEWGKPQRGDTPSLPRELCGLGRTVLSLDVRGVGETDPSFGRRGATANGWERVQWIRDSLALNFRGYTGRTLVGMQTEDVIRAVDYLAGQPEFAGRPITLVGEGLGGFWALVAGGLEERVSEVVVSDSLLSFGELLGSKYYEQRGYWWIPDAPRDFELYELPALLAPRPVRWLRPTDAMDEPVDPGEAAATAAWTKALTDALGGRLEYVAGATDPAALAQLVAQP